MAEYDVVIIGSGTAGQTAAAELSTEPLRIALIESSDMPGGVCALRGCQPKKWFYETMEAVARCHDLYGKGIETVPTPDWQQVLEEKNNFTEKIPQNTIKNLEGMGIEYIRGTPHFLDEKSVHVNGRTLSSRFFLIATGARPAQLPFKGSEHTLTSREFLDLKKIPKRITFIGGGFISFEFAHFVSRFGARKGDVHILEAGPRPLGPFDADLVGRLVDASHDLGIHTHTDIEISSIHHVENTYVIELKSGARIVTDLVINGAGRTPNIETLKLETAGIAFTEKGIEVDSSMKTTNDSVFAAGDCTGTVKLARVADFEARTAAKAITANLSGKKSPIIDYSAVPAVLFTYPQLGMVGKTEEQLKQENVKYWKSYDSGLSWPTYRRVGMRHAAFKILIDGEDRLLGAHILADNTTGLLNTFKQAMIDSTPIRKLRDDNIMAPYPSRESDIIYMLNPLLE